MEGSGMKEGKEIERKLVSTGELAEALSISIRTIARLKRAGVITPIRITTACIRYDVNEVLQQLREQEEVQNER
jgi:DNA-binding transcriptional MerR regulator